MKRSLISSIIISVMIDLSWAFTVREKPVSSSALDIISHVKDGSHTIDVEFCDVHYGRIEEVVNSSYVVAGTDDIVYKTLDYEDSYKLAPFLACDHDWLLGPFTRLARQVITNVGKVDMDAIKMVLAGNGTEADGIKQFILGQKGVFIVTGLGLLIGLLMPIVALCFCCCRCCGRCGGKFTVNMARGQTRKRCAILGFIFSITFVHLLAGSGSLYTVGTRMLHTKDQLLHLANFTVDDVMLYKDEIFNHLDQVASADLNFTVDYIDQVLNDTGVRITGPFFTIQSDPIKNELMTALNSLLSIIGSIDARFVTINAAVNGITTSYTSMTTKLGQIRIKIQDMKDTCSHTIPDCSQLPGSADIHPTYDFSQTPDLTDQENFLAALKTFDIGDIKAEILAAYEDIPERVKNSSVTVTSDVNSTMKTIADTIEPQLTSMRSTIDNATESVNDLEDGITTLGTSTDEYIKLGDYALMGLSGVVLFILLISVCAFLHALCGIRHIFVPEKRNVFIHCGRNCLMIGVLFSFIFATLFFLLGSILFFVGAQLTMICEPIQDHSIFQFIDDPEMWDGKYLLGDAILGDGTINLTANRIVEECKNNSAVYETLMLAHVFDVSTFVDIESQMPNMTALYNLIQAELANIDVVSDDTYNGLVTLNGTTALPFDVTTLMSGLRGGEVSLVLTLAASNDTIKQAQTYVTPHDSGYTTDYGAEILKMDGIIGLEQSAITGNVSLLNYTLISLEADLQAAKTAIQAIHEKAGNLETFIQGPGPGLIVQGTEKFILDVLDIADDYVNHISKRLKHDVARCHVVYDIYHGISFSLCSFFLDAFNGLWLSVCVIAIFLIPHIILSVKLSRYFRRPDDTSEYLQAMQGTRNFAVELKGATARQRRV